MKRDVLRRALARLALVDRPRALACLSLEEAEAFDRDFPSWAHDGQCPPLNEWRTWVIMGGRGFGKTRAGAEWIAGLVRAAVRGDGANGGETLRIALVGATIDEARRVMVEGPSGLLNVARDLVEHWHPSRLLLRLAGGSEAQIYSGASPESLRGPEHSHAWCDELAKWHKAEASWAMLQLGLRVGERPRALITTTPKDGPLLGRILAEPGTVVSGGRTRANPHLPLAFVAAVEGLYGGTRMGRLEIDGEYDGTVAGQLFPAALIAACRVFSPLPAREGSGVGRIASDGAEGNDGRASSPHAAAPPPTPPAGGRGESLVVQTPIPPASGGETRSCLRHAVPDDPTPSPLRVSSPPDGGRGDSFLMQTWPADPVLPTPRRYERVAIGVDPPTGGGTCGIVACAVDRQGHGHVLADHSVTGASPEGWARAVVAAVAAYADVCSNGAIVVAEINQGGAMVKSVLRKAGLTAFIRQVHAKEGKAERAVPIAMLFEQGRVSLHGEMAMLEEELGGLIAGAAYQGPGASPDRADAMVWALGEVMTRRVVRVSGF